MNFVRHIFDFLFKEDKNPYFHFRKVRVLVFTFIIAEQIIYPSSGVMTFTMLQKLIPIFTCFQAEHSFSLSKCSYKQA